MTFTGFTQSGLNFLAELSQNDKAWLDEHRSQYVAEIASPAKEFVRSLGAELQDRISPGLEAQPKTNGSIGPINNDLRFLPDASPYKDHVLFRFWEGPTKKTAATLFVRVSATEGIGFATGLVFSDVGLWRSMIDNQASGSRFASTLDALVDATSADVVGEGLKKVPKPFDADHPRSTLLRHKMIQVRWSLPTPGLISTPDFAPWCADQLEACADLHNSLVPLG